MMRVLIAVTIFAISLAVVGCSDSGVKRMNLSGTVDFDGKPIPFGKISFRPDREKGGSGPAGFAEIVNGQYSTKDTGKGSVAGPVTVAIEGYESDAPMSPGLFETYVTTTDVSSDVKSFDITVPPEAVTRRFKARQKSRAADSAR